MWGWMIVAAAIYFQAISFGIGFYGITFWMDPWMRDFGASRAEILIAPMCFAMGYGIVSPLVGRAVDGRSIRGLICAGAVFQALGFVLIGVSTAIWQIIAIYSTLLAAGISLCGPLVGQALAVRWFHERRGLAIGMVSTGTSVGALLLPHLVAALLTTFGWRKAHLLSAGVIVLAIVPIAWLVVRNAPQDAGIHVASGASRAPEINDDASWTVQGILSQPVFWILAITMFVLATVVNAVPANLAPLAQDLGFKIQQVPMLLSIYACALIPANIVLGGLSDRWDSRYLYWFSTTSLAVALLVMLGSPTYGMLMFACLLLGFAESCIQPLKGITIGRHFGTIAFGRALGLIILLVSGLGMLGSMVLGWTRDYTGSYRTGLVAGLLSLIPASILMVWLPKAKARPCPGR